MERSASSNEESTYLGPWGAEGIPEPVVRLVLDWFVQAYDSYKTSSHFAKLSDTEQHYSYAATRSFVLMMLIETGETPKEWSRQGIEFAFDELLPHDMPQSREYEQAFLPLVLSFVGWLAESGSLPQARKVVDWLQPFLPTGHERCDCAIRTEAIDVADRVMQTSGLNPESLLDRAVYIAKYTETLCGEMEADQPAVDNPSMVLELMCPCGSGRKFDECCGGAN